MNQEKKKRMKMMMLRILLRRISDLVTILISKVRYLFILEREFKISFLAQLVLFLGMTGMAIYIAVSLSSVC